MAITSY